MKILLAIDDSKFSEAAVQSVIDRAAKEGAEVRVLHVVEPPSMPLEFVVSAAGEMAGYMPKLGPEWEAESKRAETLVATIAAELRAKGMQATSVVEQGDPKSKIIEHAMQWHADLIVLGSHGRTGLDRFLLGSVSEAVARHAPCSVEIVKVPHAA
jgi:nucleotide-binding universal stress UspA family protein